MRVPASHRRGSAGINMTPMIDVVFQLLIFFLVSSHLAKQEAQLKLPLPTANSGLKDAAAAGRRVTVNLLGDGSILLAGRPTPPAELEQRLTRQLADTGPGLEVRIRSDRSVPYRHVEPVLLSCARAGVWNVSFAVYRPEDVR